MTKEEILKKIELELKDFYRPYELNLVDFIGDFFKKRKITPQEEIDEKLKFLMENISDVSVWNKFRYEYHILIIMRDNPNWKDDLKEEYKNNFKKTLILRIIPVFLLIDGFEFVFDRMGPLYNLSDGAINGVFQSDLIIYYFQLLMLNIIIPIFIYNPLNPKIHFTNGNYDIVYSEILRRYNVGGNLLFFSSLILIIIKSWTFEFEEDVYDGSAFSFGSVSNKKLTKDFQVWPSGSLKLL